MAHMDHKHSARKETGHLLLWTSCALMALLLASDAVSLMRGCDLWSATGFSFAGSDAVTPIGMLVTICCIVLEALCIARAYEVLRLNDADTHDLVAANQLVAIALAGLTIVDWGVTSLLANAFDLEGFSRMLLSLIPCIAYYRAMAKENHSGFWTGIRITSPDEPPLEIGELPTELVLSSSGMLEPVKGQTLEPSRPRVCIGTLQDLTQAYEGTSLSARAMRILKNASQTAVYPLGDHVVGTLCVPDEKVAMAGPALGGTARLGFYLGASELVLVADNDPARRLVSWYLREQYLAKQSLGEALIELQEVLIEEDAESLAGLDARIDLLEAGLSDSVSEVPQDFSDYVNVTRHDLAALYKFYQQMADTADDALADDVLVGQRESHLLAGLSRRAASLAEDSQELRDYLSQVRDGYQERIDVRQNGIMSILTIVTSISTPVALITGWYGMNFASMSELQYPFSYGAVTIICVVIVTAEILYFKRRRWF